MKNQRGITLIALVITIIIMLILVAVSVTIVMQGGLFNRAKMASLQTKYSAEREELLIHTMGNAYDAISGSLDLKKLAQDTYFTSNWDIVNPSSFSAVNDDTTEIVVKKKGSDSGIEYTITRAGARVTDNAATIFAQNGITHETSNTSIINNTTSNNVVDTSNSIVGKYYKPRKVWK